MVAVSCSETSVSIFQTAWCNIQKHSHLLHKIDTTFPLTSSGLITNNSKKWVSCVSLDLDLFNIWHSKVLRKCQEYKNHLQSLMKTKINKDLLMYYILLLLFHQTVLGIIRNTCYTASQPKVVAENVWAIPLMVLTVVSQKMLKE
jgi:hypothetical protein